MRIKDAATSYDPTIASRNTPAAKPSTTSADASTRVTVSGRAHELAARSVRVEQLRDAVASGALRIDANAIAQKLVGDDP